MPAPAVIRVHRSNCTEVLAGALGDLLAVPSGGPLDAECVVVQSHGMAAWLSRELARRFGVWANGDFSFPRNFVQRAYRAALGEHGDEGGWARERLLWAVLATLPACLPRREFARLARYLGEDPQGLRRLQLCQRIARTFDQYLTYRPEMVLAWENGDDGDLARRGQRWQPMLWRALAAHLGAAHVAARESAFQSALAAGAPLSGMPARVALFGIASLPPLYVRVLVALAHRIEVRLFLPAAAPPGAAGHPLLDSLGALGAELEQVLHTAAAAAGVELRAEDRFAPPPSATLLGRVQADVVRGIAAAPAPRALPRGRAPRAAHPTLPFTAARAVTPPDRSITLHSCHAPIREVEVLRDQLLDLLAQDTAIEPRDVVVMMADVETYAPLVESVFGADPADPLFIPYRIADRKTRSESPVVEAFQRMLVLVSGRAPASAVLDLLRLEPVQRRFGLEPGDLEQVTEWVMASGTRWGIDAADRERHGQPDATENTWEFGLARMLLGYAMPLGERATFADVLPYEEIEGREAGLLGRLAEFCARLFDQLGRLREPRRLAEWRDALGELLDAMLAQDAETSWQHQRIRGALAALAERAAEARFDDPVDLAVIRALLEPQIDEAHPERGFLSRGVTFCAFLPMRSIPFKVVGMLGMSDGAFPRADRPVDFDLIGRGAPRAGDRQRRTDDRYLFLEALLAARERVIVTYTGQSIRDNAVKPPSVLVAELLDVLAEICGMPREDLVVRHPLQGFSRRYFDGADPRLFSYAESYREGAASLGPERRRTPRLFTEPLPEPRADEAAPVLALDELVRFVRNPVAYLLNRRLSVWLGENQLDVSDREPLELDPLQRYQVGDRLLELRLAGIDAATSLALERARGALPPGGLGVCAHDDVLATAAEIALQLAEVCQPPARPSMRVWHPLPDGVRLAGTIDRLWPQAMVRAQFSRIRAKHLLEAWVRHLALCWVAKGDDPRCTVLAGRDRRPRWRGGPPEDLCCVWWWRPVADPAAELLKLKALMPVGLRAPLRFVPETSLAWALARRDGRDAAQALDAAVRTWNARDGERVRDPHLRRVFGDLQPPFDTVVTEGPTFAELAEQVFTPLLDHRQEQRIEREQP